MKTNLKYNLFQPLSLSLNPGKFPSPDSLFFSLLWNQCLKNNFSFHLFLVHRGQIFKISKVDALVDPPMYQLSDLLDAVLPGRYYPDQLKLSPNPDQIDYWVVDKILKTRRRKGKTEHLVKFLYYPGAFFVYNSIDYYKIVINQVL